MPKTMILRFRDLSTPAGDTIRLHKEIIQSKGGYVWWGWWALPTETVPREVFAYFSDVISSSGGLTVFLVDSGANLLYKASISEIKVPPSSAAIDTPEPEKTPNYYIRRTCKAWFKLTSIEPCEVAELGALSYDEVEGFLQDPTSSVFANKRIFSIEEMLGRLHRTIYFAKEYDPTHHLHHEVRLAAPPRQPVHFSLEPRFRQSNYIIHISDLHFGRKHGFPQTDGPTGRTISSLLIEDLTNLGKGPPAAIIISGDLTWQGKPEEFRDALSLISVFRSLFEIDPYYDIVVVPGNHDIKWAEQPGEGYDPKQKIEFSGDEAEANYRDFFARAIGLPPNRFLSLGRRYLLRNYVSVDLVGLNSCRVETRPFAGYGQVGLDQVKDAADKMDWPINKEGTTFRLAVLHHHVIPVDPVEQLNENHNFSLTLDAGQLLYKMLELGVDAVCHGHQHQPFLSCVSKPTKTKAYDGSRLVAIHGTGSVGVARDKLGVIGKNSYSIYEFDNEGVSLSVRATSDNFTGFEPWWSERLVRTRGYGLHVAGP